MYTYTNIYLYIYIHIYVYIYIYIYIVLYRSAANYGPMRQVFHTAPVVLVYGTGAADPSITRNINHYYLVSIVLE